MGIKFKTLAALWAACLSMVGSQPIACTEDTQCSDGFYCEESAHYCRECLRCDELKRESPAHAAQGSRPCVKSVLQCGVCFQGLVEDLRLDRACVPLAAQAPGEHGALPTYIWVLTGFAAAFVICLIAFAVFVVFKKGNILHILKISATTSVSPGSGLVAPSAPDAPPPGYDEACAERPASPDAPLASHPDEDASRPFIKRAGSWRAAGARAAAGTQAARPFSNPAYIRGPASYIPSDESEPGSPFPPPDDETLESPWTPNEPANNNTITNIHGYTVEEVPDAAGAGAAGGATGAVARTRRASTDAGPPSKTLCVRDESNNSNDGLGGAAAGGAGDEAGGAVVFVINNVTNVNLPRH